MNKQELTKILKQHKLWLNGDGGDRANLWDANLSGANLSSADLSYANLRSADLSSADLSSADLSSAKLSGVIGLLDPAAWVKENFEISSAGIIVYKAFGTGLYNPPNRWEIAEGSYITEVCNSCRADTCGCGVNFGTMKWIHNNIKNPSSVWKCLIEWIDLVSVVVPYNTDGKGRCERLRLVERITDDL